MASSSEAWEALKGAMMEMEVRRVVALFPRVYAAWWRTLFRESPEHVAVETVLILFVIFLVMKGSRKKEEIVLTESEIDDLVADWEPVSLVPPEPADGAEEERLVTRYDGDFVHVDSRRLLNCATLDVLGLSRSEELKDAAKKALRRYGCGSCGPRGFYGSIDVHVELEERLAEFFGSEKAIAFSDASSCCTSTIAAFAKRGDMLVVDEGISEALLTGCSLSRASVTTYAHCDSKDLARILESIQADDIRKKRAPGSQRRFIVCEAVFRDHGTLSPLPEIVRLKDLFGYRLVVDESLTFGVCGTTGRGAKEYFSLPEDSVEITTIDLGPSLGSVGGVCLGTAEVIDHQRLSGAGYCFSAAAPPFVSAAALRALDILETSRSDLASLQKNVRYVHDKLARDNRVLSQPPSPLVFVGPYSNTAVCKAAVEAAAEAGFAVSLSRHCAKNPVRNKMRPKPIALKIALNAHHTSDQLDVLCDTILARATS